MNRHYALTAAIILAAATASAEDTPTPADDAVHAGLAEVAPDEFPEHGCPNIIISSHDRRFALGIGGMVKATASFDWGDPTDNGYAFLTSEIPSAPAQGDGAKWQFNAQTSMIYLNFVALPGDKNQVGAYINFNFTGNNYCPALQYAYLRWRGLSVGYTYSLFTDQQASVPTIDYQGPNSFTGVQAVAVNYEQAFGPQKRWRFGAGLNMPQTSITPAPGMVREVNQRLPDIPVFLQYGSADGASHIRFSAILRNLYYRDLKISADGGDGRNIDQLGWGIKLSGMTPITPSLAVMGQVVYGEGITSYYQDLSGAGLDLAYTGRDGVMAPVRSWGGYLGLDWSITDRLHLSGAYSHIRLYPGSDTLPDTDATYRYAQYAVGTLFYNFTDWLGGGLEYIYGRRVQLDGSQHHDSRLQAALSFTF